MLQDRSSTTPADQVPAPAADRVPTPATDRAPTPPADRVPTPTDDRVPTPTDDRVPTPTDDRVPTPTDDRVPTPTDDRVPTPTDDGVPTPNDEAKLRRIRILNQLSNSTSMQQLEAEMKRLGAVQVEDRWGNATLSLKNVHGLALLIALQTNKTRFMNEDAYDLEAFKMDCDAAINEALNSDFAKPSNITKILYDLAFFIANLVTLGAASLISYARTGDARFFKVPQTEAEKMVADVQERVSAMSVAG